MDMRYVKHAFFERDILFYLKEQQIDRAERIVQSVGYLSRLVREKREVILTNQHIKKSLCDPGAPHFFANPQ